MVQSHVKRTIIAPQGYKMDDDDAMTVTFVMSRR
jgi:hypothetical protein